MSDDLEILDGEFVDLPPHPVKNILVTATVRDKDGTTWINCGVHAVLVGYVGGAPIFLQDGTKVPTSFNSVADAQGNLSIDLPANDAMIPPKTRWRLTFIPVASCAPSVFDFSVTGQAPIDASAVITANLVVPRFKLIPGAYGYADVEISPKPNPGTQSIGYVNTTTGNLRIWNGYIFVDVAQGALPANAVQLMPHINTGNLTITGDTKVATLEASASITAGTTIAAGTSITAATTSGVFDGVTHTTLYPAQVNVANQAIIIGQKIGAALGTTAEVRTDNSIPATFLDAWGQLNINSGRAGVNTHIFNSLLADILQFGAATSYPSPVDMQAARPLGLYHCAQNCTNMPPSLGTTYEVYWLNLGMMILCWCFNHTPPQLYYVVKNNVGWGAWQAFTSTAG